MKKQLLLSAVILFTAGSIFMTGCKKDDTTPPDVTLIGDAAMTISLQSTVTDPGATAEDGEDGDISASVTSDWSTMVNVNLKGTYTVTYSVTDAAGNTGTATRTVTVVNDADYLAGTYATKDSVYNPLPPYVSNYSETITASSTVNNRVWVTRFGNYDNGAVYIDRTSSTAISLPNQTVTCGTPANSRIFGNTFPSGGTISTTGATTLTLDYKETVISPASTANAVSVWVKQ